MGATHLSGLAIKPKASTSAAIILTEWEHSGKTLVLNLATAQALTLPKATGSGAKFKLFVGITKTGACTIKVVDSADTMSGTSYIQTAVPLGFATVAATDTVSLLGTTTGGVLGSTVEFEDVAATKWAVRHVGISSGAAVTPFSATV